MGFIINFKDEKQVLQLLRELAIYEGKKFSDIPIVESSFVEHAFSSKYFNIFIAEYQNKIVGVALYFFIPSRFDINKKVLFLNDLYITPEYRGRGIGTTLLTEMQIIAQQHNCYRVEWELDNMDEKAKDFYKKMGAVIESCSSTFILKGDELLKLASSKTYFTVCKNKNDPQVDYFTVMRDQEIIGSALTYQFYSSSKGYPVMYIGDIYFVDEDDGYKIVQSLLTCIAQSTVSKNCGRIQLRSSPGSLLINRVLEEIGGEFDRDYAIAKVPCRRPSLQSSAIRNQFLLGKSFIHNISSK